MRRYPRPASLLLGGAALLVALPLAGGIHRCTQLALQAERRRPANVVVLACKVMFCK